MVAVVVVITSMHIIMLVDFRSLVHSPAPTNTRTTRARLRGKLRWFFLGMCGIIRMRMRLA